MKKVRVLLILMMAAVLLVVGCASAPPTADFSITSSVDNNHSHKVVITGADVDNPPAQKVITSDGANHTHTVTLTKQDYEAIKKGQEITITSSPTGATPHTHTFKIKKA